MTEHRTPCFDDAQKRCEKSMDQIESRSPQYKTKPRSHGPVPVKGSGSSERIAANPLSTSKSRTKNTPDTGLPEAKELLGLSEEEFAIFIEESGEVIDDIGRVLVAFEENPSDLELMNELFRSFHTLKGIGAAVGFEAMAKLSHATESVLDTMRQGSLQLDPHVADLLYKAVDALAAMQRDLVSARRIPEEPPVGLDDLCESLMAVAPGAYSTPVKLGGSGKSGDLEGDSKKERYGSNHAKRRATKEEASPPLGAHPRDPESGDSLSDQERAGAGERNTLNITVRPLADADMPEVRVYQVLKTLRGIGVVSHSDPAPEAIENGMVNLDGRAATFTVVTPYDREQLSSILQSIPDIHCEVEPAETQETPVAAKGTRTAPDSGPNQTIMTAKDLARTIRVSVNLLDNLMDLVGELVIDKTQLSAVLS
ncbi:MAG TPA: hypothetical protein GX507_09950, partial [Clostridia bacterium]|nr:hypothetical protein [Clostridia bacterium]